jgi:hypothetical protein
MYKARKGWKFVRLLDNVMEKKKQREKLMRETTWRGASVVEEENDARARDRNVLSFALLSASILNRLYIHVPPIYIFYSIQNIYIYTHTERTAVFSHPIITWVSSLALVSLFSRSWASSNIQLGHISLIRSGAWRSETETAPVASPRSFLYIFGSFVPPPFSFHVWCV